jgi:hypothetical protein
MEPLPDRLPLVIGVTGHRDLRDQDIATLEREIAGIIAGLRRDYLGDDRDTPIIVLSSLAEGADRVVARVALAHDVRLVAPLPMPVEVYREDFEPGLKPGNAAEFDALLAQAIAAPVVPFMPGNSLEAVRTDRKRRAEQYRAVGLFIVQHCNVLLALWDGDSENMATGGTAEVVAFKRQGIPLSVSGSARVSLDGSEIGPVIHVVAPREKETSAVAEVVVRPWGRAVIKRYRGGIVRRAMHEVGTFVADVFGREHADERSAVSDQERGELEAWEAFEALTAQTCRFNREAAALAGNLDALFGKTGAPPSVDPASAKQHAIEGAPRWCRMYAIADTLAQLRQARFRRDWLQVFSFAVLAFFCFALFSHIGIASNLLLVLYSLGFVAMFAVFIRAHVGQHQRRFLDYRALAEAFRVAVYWKLAGIGPPDLHAGAAARRDPWTVDAVSFGVIANAYPIRQPRELSWVKICLRALGLLSSADAAPAKAGLDRLGHAIARYYWVEGQCTFFRDRELRYDRIAERFESDAIVLFVLGPFFIVPLLLAFTSPPDGGQQSSLRQALLIISGLLPGIAAALTNYSDRLAFKAQARQYDRMRVLFERAHELLPETIDDETAPLAQAVYAELGTEALREHAEWVAIYRQRPIQPPK